VNPKASIMEDFLGYLWYSLEVQEVRPLMAVAGVGVAVYDGGGSLGMVQWFLWYYHSKYHYFLVLVALGNEF
jgi:hypothetical protein